MLSILRRRLASGIATSRYPQVAEASPPAFRGMPVLNDAVCLGDGACAAICPTEAIRVSLAVDEWTWRLDRAACTGCGLCMEACPYAALGVSAAFELASRTRADLVETLHFTRSSGARETEAVR
jgi:formate hydrogenlyase subunit 6/NADH:ubiquinone oxidoreductase subunit I